jgi:hypothetical protein
MQERWHVLSHNLPTMGSNSAFSSAALCWAKLCLRLALQGRIRKPENALGGVSVGHGLVEEDRQGSLLDVSMVTCRSRLA